MFAKLAFGALVAASLVAGFLALYARDVRRDRGATRAFAIVGATSTIAAVAVGWTWL